MKSLRFLLCFSTSPFSFWNFSVRYTSTQVSPINTIEFGFRLGLYVYNSTAKLQSYAMCFPNLLPVELCTAR